VAVTVLSVVLAWRLFISITPVENSHGGTNHILLGGPLRFIHSRFVGNTLGLRRLRLCNTANYTVEFGFGHIVLLMLEACGSSPWPANTTKALRSITAQNDQQLFTVRDTRCVN
jgi:hypothetical protein